MYFVLVILRCLQFNLSFLLPFIEVEKFFPILFPILIIRIFLKTHFSIILFIQKIKVFQLRRKAVNPDTGSTDFWIINANLNVKRILLMADVQDALTTWDHIKEDYIGSRRRIVLP